MDYGDVDNDGDMDMYIPNLAHPRVRPYSDPSMYVINGGPPTYAFTDRTTAAGLIYDEGDVNAAFGDYDNDGDLDLAIASLYGQHYSRLYRNDGATGYTDVTYETGTAVHDAVSVVWADVDADGDLDLLVTGRAVDSKKAFLFKNQAAGSNRWVELKLQGSKTNRDAVGARVTLRAGGVTRIRDVRGGGGHNVQGPLMLHFGLGSASTIDEVKVRWVGSGSEAVSGVAPGGRYRIVEGTGTATLLK
jgi:hypothetical protein